ncbi:MAG: SGNH/GDSL hydrolase family protein [Ruminococcaceae bacterium]|nr:SGNH/GDSL hydrolase family protein [Oscillospiraceae bacterium]
MELQGKTINFLGDSITEGHGTSAPDKKFTALLAAKYGVISRNYGIGGTRIAKQHTPSIEPRWDRDFITRVAEMETDADAVVVFGGTNDYGHGDAPLGVMSDRDRLTFYGALHTLYNKLITKYPDKPIVIVTPLHRCNELSLRGDGGKLQDAAPLKAYVDIIREVAEYYSLPVLDLYKNSGMQPEVPIIKERYIPDGLHPNDAGHEILAAKIAAFLRGI